MWDEVKADRETVMNLSKIVLSSTSTEPGGLQPFCQLPAHVLHFIHKSHTLCVQYAIFVWNYIYLLFTATKFRLIRNAEDKIFLELIGCFFFFRVVHKNTIKWSPFQFLLLWLLTCFFDGFHPDITGSSHVSLAQPQKAPADHSSRQGGVGHSRGRSYQRAAECEGQKSWCIQAHHTVTRHSSAQGPSEQPTLALNRLLMNRPDQGLYSKKYTCRKAFIGKETKNLSSKCTTCAVWLHEDKIQSFTIARYTGYTTRCHFVRSSWRTDHW